VHQTRNNVETAILFRPRVQLTNGIVNFRYDIIIYLIYVHELFFESERRLLLLTVR